MTSMLLQKNSSEGFCLKSGKLKNYALFEEKAQCCQKFLKLTKGTFSTDNKLRRSC